MFFLEHHEDFKNKYALAVITRIFYTVNTSRTGQISLKELRNSNLLEAFLHVDEDTDINRAVDFFSYEHFYVLYCKFFELDTDRDFIIHREDLVKYADHSLSENIVDRIFQLGLGVFDQDRGSHRPYIGMTFSDFIYFAISEEDKTTTQSITYWFNCVDLDGDGTHSPRYLLTHSIALTHSLTHLLTYSLTHSLTYLLTHSLTTPLTQAEDGNVMEKLKYFHVDNAHCYDPNEELKLRRVIGANGTHSLTHTLTHSHTHTLTHSHTHTITHSLTHSFSLLNS